MQGEAGEECFAISLAGGGRDGWGGYPTFSEVNSTSGSESIEICSSTAWGFENSEGRREVRVRCGMKEGTVSGEK